MTITVESGGRRRVVGARRAGPGEDGWAVILDGVERPVRLVRQGGAWSLLLGSGRAGHYDSHEVRVEPRGRGSFGVHVNGTVVPVTVNGRGRASVHGGAAGADGTTSIVAPMPGRVIRVLVQAGDPVEPRQGLVIVEAMKMENELRSPAAGVVREVLTAPGASVEANAVLVVVGPRPA